ncbi:hypothetical protein GCM10028805_49640 [Spirosoma harenae]
MNDVPKSFWEATYRQNIAKMIGVCYRYTSNRQIAEDLAHDAFLVAINKSKSFESKGPFEAWLRRIVVNVALQYLRDQKKQKHHENRMAYDTPTLEAQNESQNNEENSFSEAELLEAIGRLPEHHKLVFNLYVFDHFTHAQIGTELGISEGTSKSHFARARKTIREILKNKLKEDKRKPRLLFLFWISDKFWNINHFFRKGLKNFEIKPQKSSSINIVDFAGVSIPKPNSSIILFVNYIKSDITTVATVMNIAIVSFIHVNSNEETKPSVVKNSSVPSVRVSDLPNEKGIEKKFSNFDTTTATFSTNGIISSENTKQIDTMKKVNTLGALLLTTSALSFDSTSLLNKFQLPSQLKNQEIVENNSLELTIPIEQSRLTDKVDPSKIHGTFYASKLFWSSKDNTLYLKGENVKVNLNTQKFNGSGTFSFINRINYLVVNGTPMQINETIELTDKKYSLVKLSEEQAIKRYGDKGKVIVEIALVD